MTEIAWPLTLFLVHVAALCGAMALYPRAPCWMQKLTVAGVIAAMLIVTIAYGVALLSHLFPDLGLWGMWQIFILGLVIEHLAVLLLIFRLVYQVVLWPSSLPRSHRSPV